MTEGLQAQFEALGLVDRAQQDFAREIIKEGGEDRVEAILGLVELPEETALPLVQHLLKELDAQEAQNVEPAPASAPLPVRAVIRAPSPDQTSLPRQRELSEEERIQRERLLKQYGTVEEDVDDADAPPDLAPAGVTARPAKSKGKAPPSDGDLLLFSNDNAAAVKAAEQKKRDEAAKQSAAKKERDKADLLKQRADQAKRKEEARKKAARSERKA